jgi:hypothetical protein
MTFNFNASLVDDLSWVRFQIADTDSAGYYLQDETIQYLIDDTSKKQAVIDCIENIIAQLSAPTTKLDWLTVDYSQARAGYEALLKRKKQSLGITGGASLTLVTSHPWRADSDQTDGDYNYSDDTE